MCPKRTGVRWYVLICCVEMPILYVAGLRTILDARVTMRRTARRFVMEGCRYAIPCTSLPTASPDVDPTVFHTTCLPDLYQPVAREAPLSKCRKMFHRRIVVSAPVALGGKCLRVPFVVGTGAPSTYLHPVAVQKFIGQGSLVSDSYSTAVCGVPLKAATHDTQHGHVAHLNVLGMDFLDDAAPELMAFFSEAFASYVTRANEVDVFVTDGKGTTAPITAEGARVMHLKLAIKKALPLTA